MANLTDKQKKAIDFMLGEIATIIDEDHFQYDFYESLLSQFETKNWLSEKQIDALTRMHERVTE